MNRIDPIEFAGADWARADEGLDRPFEVLAPRMQTIPFVFVSPHSGRVYPPAFVAQSRLDPLSLRRSEDAFVDELFAAAPDFGAPLLKANFPRAFVDVNREPYELDPAMFRDPLPPYANTTSNRVAGGLGTIARVVGDERGIYREKLSFAEAQRRIETYYKPFHQALHDLIAQTHARFGCAVLIDCHSMPSMGGVHEGDRGHWRPGIVLGDRFGTSCARALSVTAERVLRGCGYHVLRNNPYAGGYNTEHYAAPAEGRHALQIEINRALYMDEERVERGPGLSVVAGHMRALIAVLAELDPALLRPRG